MKIMFNDEEKEVSKTDKILGTVLVIPVMLGVFFIVTSVILLAALIVGAPFAIFLNGVTDGSTMTMIAGIILALLLWR